MMAELSTPIRRRLEAVSMERTFVRPPRAAMSCCRACVSGAANVGPGVVGVMLESSLGAAWDAADGAPAAAGGTMLDAVVSSVAA